MSTLIDKTQFPCTTLIICGISVPLSVAFLVYGTIQGMWSHQLGVMLTISFLVCLAFAFLYGIYSGRATLTGSSTVLVFERVYSSKKVIIPWESIVRIEPVRPYNMAGFGYVRIWYLASNKVLGAQTKTVIYGMPITTKPDQVVEAILQFIEDNEMAVSPFLQAVLEKRWK